MTITYDRMHLRSKAEQYCSTNDTNISRELGFGTQGIVFKSGHNTAIKVYNLQDGYRREKSVYTRLEERKVHSVQEMSIPRIVGWDDELLTFEMSIVHVPCVIDFGGATWSDQHHAKVVCTRHYRPPEVILDCGWHIEVGIWIYVRTGL